MNTEHCSQNLKYHSTDTSVLIHAVLRAHSPDAVGTQYLTHSALRSSTFALSSDGRSLLRRYTTRSFAYMHGSESAACEHNYPSLCARCLAVRWLLRHPLDARCIAVRRLHRHPLFAQHRSSSEDTTREATSSAPLNAGLNSVVSLPDC